MTGRLDAEKEFNKLIIAKVNKGYRIGKREELPRGYPKIRQDLS
jgi:predicted DNA-binding WGR domain protein